MNRAYGVGGDGLWIVLNPMLRVVAVLDPRPDGGELGLLSRLLHDLPPPGRFLGFEIAAPVLVLSDVFEPELCRHLVAGFEAHGGRPSGFMQEVGGRTLEVHDPAWKRRSDQIVTEPALVAALRARLGRRVVPEILKAFAFRATRIERELVACYRAEEGGHFGPHRDDTVAATAHRRFAVSINLNDDFEGGLLSFPEYGSRGLKPRAGTAVVFSCAVLHQVGRVTAGRRYAFLPFLFDEAAERLRQDLAPRVRPAP
jgi:predicted 2-oxoglutarate/Fe(II)-dependent dioxygenase YbiX